MTRVRVDSFLARRVSSSKGRRSGAMVGVARVSVTLSIIVILVAISVILGFKESLSGLLTGLASHITVDVIQPYGNTIEPPLVRNAEFEQEVAQMEGFASIAPFATKSGIVRSEGGMHGVLLRGVDSTADCELFSERLTEGAMPRLGEETRYKEVLISQTLARLLEMEVGDKVEFVFTSEHTPLRRDAYKVCGIYSSGMASMEQGLVLTDIRNVQRINGWSEEEVTGYKIMATDFEAMEPLCINVRKASLFAGESQAWRTLHLGESYPQIFDWMATHDINGVVVVVIMLIVALLNMISALLIIIFERMRMIGTLKALGMRNRVVQRVFLRCSLGVILEGLLWGNLIGGGLLLIQHLTGIVALNPEAYLIDRVPVGFDWGLWIGVNIAIPVIITLLLMIPVAITSRIKPAHTLKYQ